MTVEPHSVEPAAEPHLETPLHHPTRAQVLVGWLVWHAQEIAGVGVLAGLAMVSGWWPLWILTGLAGGGWIGHELHQAHQTHQVEG